MFWEEILKGPVFFQLFFFSESQNSLVCLAMHVKRVLLFVPTVAVSQGLQTYSLTTLHTPTAPTSTPHPVQPRPPRWKSVSTQETVNI